MEEFNSVIFFFFIFKVILILKLYVIFLYKKKVFTVELLTVYNKAKLDIFEVVGKERLTSNECVSIL